MHVPAQRIEQLSAKGDKWGDYPALIAYGRLQGTVQSFPVNPVGQAVSQFGPDQPFLQTLHVSDPVQILLQLLPHVSKGPNISCPEMWHQFKSHSGCGSGGRGIRLGKCQRSWDLLTLDSKIEDQPRLCIKPKKPSLHAVHDLGEVHVPWAQLAPQLSVAY